MSAAPQPAPENAPELPEIPPGIRRSQEAYWHDLPQLLPLRSRARQWVAFHGDERVGFGKTQGELYDECFRRGFKSDEVYVGRLEPQEAPPWVPIDMDAFDEGQRGEAAEVTGGPAA